MNLDILRADSGLAYYKLFILSSDISRFSVMMFDSVLSYSSNQSSCVYKVFNPKASKENKIKEFKKFCLLLI